MYGWFHFFEVTLHTFCLNFVNAHQISSKHSLCHLCPHYKMYCLWFRKDESSTMSHVKSKYWILGNTKCLPANCFNFNSFCFLFCSKRIPSPIHHIKTCESPPYYVFIFNIRSSNSTTLQFSIRLKYRIQCVVGWWFIDNKRERKEMTKYVVG